MNNNGGKRTPRQGANLKLLGLLPGLSDLFIFYPTPRYHGLFLEVKRNKTYCRSERLSDTWLAQLAFQERVRGVGYCAETCYGSAEGIRIIGEYLRDSSVIELNKTSL